MTVQKTKECRKKLQKERDNTRLGQWLWMESEGRRGMDRWAWPLGTAGVRLGQARRTGGICWLVKAKLGSAAAHQPSAPFASRLEPRRSYEWLDSPKAEQVRPWQNRFAIGGTSERDWLGEE